MRSCAPPNTGLFEQPAVCDRFSARRISGTFTTCYIATSASLLPCVAARLTVSAGAKFLKTPVEKSSPLSVVNRKPLRKEEVLQLEPVSKLGTTD